METGFGIGGYFIGERWSANGRLISRHYAKNGVTDALLTNALDVLCRQQPQSTWKIGLIDNDGFTGLASGDLMSSHPGWDEMIDYSETARPLWSPGTATAQSIINPFAVRFTMTLTKTINGLFVVSDNTKGGTGGILFSTGSYDTPALMLAGEMHRCFYSVAAEGR